MEERGLKYRCFFVFTPCWFGCTGFCISGRERPRYFFVLGMECFYFRFVFQSRDRLSDPDINMFINFLMGKFPHLRRVYSTDKEMVEHFLSGEVQIPFTDVLKYVEEWDKLKPKLPSAHQIDDPVKLCLMQNGERIPQIDCEVHTVHFTKSKVKYDLVVILDPEQNLATRMYNVDSAFVSKHAHK